MGTLGGLFTNQWGNDDFGAIASRVAEQLANTRAASQGEKSKKSEELAKRPQPTRQVSIVENPDGTVTHTTVVKNAPKIDPQTEVKQAEAAPQADYAHSILSGAQATIDAMPDPEKIDPALLSSRKGREKLLRDSGFDAEFDYKSGEGLAAWFGRKDRLSKILDDPEKVKRMVMAQRFNQRADIAKEARPFAQDERAGATQDRLNKIEDRQQTAEDRRQHSAEMSQFNTAIDNIRSFDLSASMKTADDAVKYWQQGYGPVWEEWGSRLEPIIRSEFDRRKVARDLSDAKAARDEAKDERTRAEWDKRVKHLELSNRNLESEITARDRKASTTSLTRQEAIDTPVDELLGYAGDDGYDQKSVTRALNTKEHTLKEERRKLKMKIPAQQATLRAMRENEPWKKSEIARMDAELRANNQRVGEIDGDLGKLETRGAGGKGRVLSKDEALKKLQQ